MGVDYYPRYGIGVYLNQIDFNDELEEKYIDIDNYFEETILQYSDKYRILEYGDGNYTGEDNEYLLIIKDPFKHGLEVFISKVNEFKEFLTEHNIQYTGEIDVVGGLHIC